jgi:hippurate hydrolase
LDASIQRIARSIAQLHGAQVDVEIHRGTPALINRGIPTELARKAAAEVVPPDYVLAMETANMGGEDFSYYVEEVPGCYVRYGSMTDERHAFPAHSSRFDIDEAALAYGASYLNRVALIAGKHLAGIHEYSHDSQAESLR